MRVAGIMSGTSLDGIDVAIVDIEQRGRQRRLQAVAFQTVPYPNSVRTQLLELAAGPCPVSQLAYLHFLLAELYAEAFQRTCQRHRIRVSSVELIGCHGQTVFHDGDGRRILGRKVAATLQIGDGSVLAERTGIPVVSDFRPRDIAAGGKGAPLVPYVDYLLFADRRLGRVALNIGGIANITAIPPSATPDEILAFDTGPGNMVIDGLVRAATRGRLQYDRDGQIASRGRLSTDLLRRLLRHPYLRRKPPKTAGREQFGEAFVGELLNSGLKLADLVATATAFTAACVAVGLQRFVRPHMRVDELIVSGGGIHNPQLMAYLAAFIPEARIRSSSEFGVDPDAKEAIAFALLAYETWHQRPSNLPAATGARHPAILGKISPGGRAKTVGQS